MVSGLEMLLGRTITHVEMVTPALDLKVEFGGNYTLRVFCDQMEKDSTNYGIRFRQRFITLNERSEISVTDWDEPL